VAEDAGVAPLPATLIEPDVLLEPPQPTVGFVDRHTAAAMPARERAAALKVVPLDLSWEVRFDGPDAPEPVYTNVLNSWTLWPGARYFSGLATYRATFEWDSQRVRTCLLAFDQIREVAAVKLNGRHMGVLFVPPLELDVAAGLQEGRNVLEITVANLPVNRFLGLPNPDPGPLREKYGDRFPVPEEKRIMPEPHSSGIIGAVRLRSSSLRSTSKPRPSQSGPRTPSTFADSPP
jgi:hypothetical protein